MTSVQGIELGLPGLALDDDALLDEALSGFTHAGLGATTKNAVYMPPSELLVCPCKHREHVTIEGGGDHAKRAPKIHFLYPNYIFDTPTIVGIEIFWANAVSPAK
jgi:hypothetical protein